MAADFSQGTALSGYWGQNVANKKDADQWLIQAGITKNWFGLGNTALFGEYSKSNDWGAGNGAGRNFRGAISGAVAVNGVTDTDTDGLGHWHHPEHRCGCHRALPELPALLGRHYGWRCWSPSACRPRTSTLSSAVPA